MEKDQVAQLGFSQQVVNLFDLDGEAALPFHERGSGLVVLEVEIVHRSDEVEIVHRSEELRLLTVVSKWLKIDGCPDDQLAVEVSGSKDQ